MRALRLAFALSIGLICGAPRAADAFCGFYVSGADAQLFNNATQVVLMRSGTRTVLSMQNNYQGPPSDFAMVVPVPIVLQRENVKTLPRGLFQRIDQLDAPRLVEYWEQDPCPSPQEESDKGVSVLARGVMIADSAPSADKQRYGVTIEAQFTVGEYEIVILSAQDSTGLDSWLRDNNYKIPAGAAPLLRPYVQAGMKFFVAKVDVKKVAFEGGMAMLSPLRFHYDSETFNLPVRLGLLSSSGTQDLIVHILARGTRYEVANYPNVTIPTNLDVAEAARDRFGGFYAALFDHTLASKPGAVVTEYAWQSTSCDPCPTPPLTPGELVTLGADVLDPSPAIPLDDEMPTQGRGALMPGGGRRGLNFVLTRLHARYTKDSLGDDLVFREAPAIEGGREHTVADGRLEQGATRGSMNNFQARYAIRHRWTGPVACDNPTYGVWGPPPQGAQVAGDPSPKAAQNLAFAQRGVALSAFVAGDLPEIGFKGEDNASVVPFNAPRSGGCGACAVAPGEEGGDTRRGALFAAMGMFAALWGFVGRRRQRSAED